MKVFLGDPDFRENEIYMSAEISLNIPSKDIYMPFYFVNHLYDLNLLTSEVPETKNKDYSPIELNKFLDRNPSLFIKKQ